jgi:hypothetical protein
MQALCLVWDQPAQICDATGALTVFVSLCWAQNYPAWDAHNYSHGYVNTLAGWAVR